MYVFVHVCMCDDYAVCIWYMYMYACLSIYECVYHMFVCICYGMCMYVHMCTRMVNVCVYMCVCVREFIVRVHVPVCVCLYRSEVNFSCYSSGTEPLFLRKGSLYPGAH